MKALNSLRLDLKPWEPGFVAEKYERNTIHTTAAASAHTKKSQVSYNPGFNGIPKHVKLISILSYLKF